MLFYLPASTREPSHRSNLLRSADSHADSNRTVYVNSIFAMSGLRFIIVRARQI